MTLAGRRLIASLALRIKSVLAVHSNSAWKRFKPYFINVVFRPTSHAGISRVRMDVPTTT
jgi:hypothetical protein